MILFLAATYIAPSGIGPGEPLEALVGQRVDIAPWTYEWRADRAIQPRPEAEFIPRRLERVDRVYRTAREALSPDELKSLYYDQADLLREFPPPPGGELKAGLLWTGGLVDYRVELQWPSDAPAPHPEDVEVRVYPTAFGWFGWTVDKVLTDPDISADGRTWTYASDPTEVMDTYYSGRVPAATEMVAVFSAVDAPVPQLCVYGPSTGEWERMDIEIEWGFTPETEDVSINGRLEGYVARLGELSPLESDATTRVTGDGRWHSAADGALAGPSHPTRARGAQPARRGLTLPLLYTPSIRPGLDSRVTLWTDAGDVTFSIKDLEAGPIYLPRHGLFITRAGGGRAAEFVASLAAEGRKSLRDMTREHREVASWDELMRQVRLWECPEGTAAPDFPEVPALPMAVELSDKRWTDAWRAACDQLRGRHLWPTLSAEIARAARVMELVGLHDEVLPVYEYFLGSPGVKSDGDFTDPSGSLEWATSMRHDMGYSHEGTHASTGRILFAMCDRTFLTGDSEWFASHRERLQAAADWIISERRRYMEHVPNRDELHVAGLMPPSMLGDYALPACDWHWYYCENAWSLQGLQRFADALSELDPKAGARYAAEAADFRRDLQAAIDHEVALAPVRLGRDGAYHSYMPRMAYAGGLTGPELGAPQFPDSDIFYGALPVAMPFGALEPDDSRVVDTLDTMDEIGVTGFFGSVPAMYAHPYQAYQRAREDRGLASEDAWFWKPYAMLPKISSNADVYLLQDDIASFLRFWGNQYAAMVGANGKLWEHWHLGSYAECDTPDTMTAGWFLENFRNLLVMEDGDILWLAKGTPRAWLEQGKRVVVRDAPTYFGPLSYSIDSEVAEGSIRATIRVPSRRPITTLKLRLRHPDAAPPWGVTVEGDCGSRLDPSGELVELTNPRGTITVTARY